MRFVMYLFFLFFGAENRKVSLWFLGVVLSVYTLPLSLSHAIATARGLTSSLRWYLVQPIVPHLVMVNYFVATCDTTMWRLTL